MDELISGIIPVYNVSEYVDEALESIINQDDVRLEIIVVDDCSSDDTFDKVQRWANRFDNIKAYKNKSNIKICKTLNFAYLMSKGEYIARFDGDDISLKARLRSQLDFIKNNKVDLVGCQMIAVNADGDILSKGKMPVGKKFVIDASKYASPIAHIWLAKREIYEKLNGYRNIPYAEDYDFILRAMDMGYCCDNLPEYLMLIRQREGNTASTASLKQRKTHRYVLELHRRRLVNKGNDDGFSEDELAKKIKSWPLTEILHSYSTKILSSAYSDKNVFRKVFKVILCCLLSYYNFEYLISRMMFKRTFM